MKLICEEIRVIGRVQGVFYRAFTQEVAQALGVTGWVKNAVDGSVIMHACANQITLENFHERLKAGPPKAKVERMEAQIIPQVNYEGFKIIR